MSQTVISSTTETPRKRIPIPLLAGGMIDPTSEAFMYEDWLVSSPESAPNRVGNNYWSWETSGGSVGPAVGEQYALGVVSLTANSGRAAVYQTFVSIEPGGATIIVRTRVKIPILATTAQAFQATVGLGDSQNATASTDEVSFQHDQTSGNWQCKTRSNNSETLTTTASGITANTWYTLMFVINAAATSVEFYAGTDGTNMSLIATHTTNIPQGAGKDMGLLVKMRKTNGSTARQFYNDYYFIRALLASPR